MPPCDGDQLPQPEQLRHVRVTVEHAAGDVLMVAMLAVILEDFTAWLAQRGLVLARFPGLEDDDPAVYVVVPDPGERDRGGQ